MYFKQTLLAAICTIGFASQAQANIIWDWSNAATGTESGTFTTDGNLVGGMAPAGSYNFLGFSLVTITDAVLGNGYDVQQDPAGFIWDGAAPTQFFRSNGTLTNGTSFSVAAPTAGVNAAIFVFDIGFFGITPEEEVSAGSLFIERQTINLAVATQPVPIPAAAWLFGSGLLGLIDLSRRKLSAA